MPTKDEFLTALDNIAAAAKDAQRKMPEEFDTRSREGRTLNALLTRLPEQIEDIKVLLVKGYKAPGLILDTSGDF
jgi:hypothetical protein